jgi:hypothetical protein
MSASRISGMRRRVRSCSVTGKYQQNCYYSNLGSVIIIIFKTSTTTTNLVWLVFSIEPWMPALRTENFFFRRQENVVITPHTPIQPNRACATFFQQRRVATFSRSGSGRLSILFREQFRKCFKGFFNSYVRAPSFSLHLSEFAPQSVSLALFGERACLTLCHDLPLRPWKNSNLKHPEGTSTSLGFQKLRVFLK